MQSFLLNPANLKTYLCRAGNFRMMEIKINAWSSLFRNLETNLILYFYPEKYIKSTNQSRVSEAGKFEIVRAI